MATQNTMLEMIQGETPEPTKTKESQIELLFQIAGNMVINSDEELEKYFKFLIKTIFLSKSNENKLFTKSIS